MRADTRQAGFCGPGTHQPKLIKGRDPEISQAPAGPSKLKRQVKTGFTRKDEMTRNTRTSKASPKLNSRLNNRERHLGNCQTTTHQGTQATTPSAEKSLHRRKNKPKRNVVIHRYPRGANTEGRQTRGIVDETPKQLKPGDIAVGTVNCMRKPD